MPAEAAALLMAIRILAVDVDGTLLDSRHQLPPRNAAALAAATAQGIQVVLATGRRFNFVLPIIAALGCPCWVIASNGALVRKFTPRDVVPGGGLDADWFRHFLPHSKARAVLSLLAPYEDQAVITMPERDGQPELFMRPERDPPAPGRRAFASWLRSNRNQLAFAAPLETCLTADPVQLMYGGSVSDARAIGAALAASPLAAELTCLQTLYPRRDLGILDVLDRGVDKGAALAAVAAQLGIGAAEVLAIGDNYNDLGMLEFAGQAVLMGNAHAAMDRPGWARTADNDHDGVAATIEALLEGR